MNVECNLCHFYSQRNLVIVLLRVQRPNPLTAISTGYDLYINLDSKIEFYRIFHVFIIKMSYTAIKSTLLCVRLDNKQEIHSGELLPVSKPNKLPAYNALNFLLLNTTI